MTYATLGDGSWGAENVVAELAKGPLARSTVARRVSARRDSDVATVLAGLEAGGFVVSTREWYTNEFGERRHGPRFSLTESGRRLV